MNFAAEGPSAKANETRMVDMLTSRVHGLSFRTLMIVKAKTKPKTQLAMFSNTLSIKVAFPTLARR